MYGKKVNEKKVLPTYCTYLFGDINGNKQLLFVPYVCVSTAYYRRLNIIESVV